MGAHSPTAVPLEVTIHDLQVGSMRLARAAGRRLTLVRTSDGVFALDHACPHEGYGLTQGKLDGNVLTCAWHNWKFRVDDGSCVLGEENVRTHEVTVGTDGSLAVTINEPGAAELRPRLVASLRRAIERNYVGQVSRDVVRLLRADANPGELVWEAVAHGAPRAEFGWGHSVASATDCLAMVDLYEGDQRALPIVQGIIGIAETERHRPVNALPDPVTELGADPGSTFRRLVEGEQLEPAQALLRGAIHAGLGADELRPWLTGVVSDHLLSYGHGAIYAQKAFQLLDRLGWERADTVLPHLLPTIVYGTRMDTLPYMRPFSKALADVYVDELAEAETDPAWTDDGRLRQAILCGAGQDRAAPLGATVTALREGAGIDGVLDVVVDAVSERMLRYDPSGEFDYHDDFGWLDITHGITYANAARWHAAPRRNPDAVRLALWCAFLAYWTGRHEWHTSTHEGATVDLGTDNLQVAGESLQRQSLDDRTSTFIVHAHGIKTSRAAALESMHSESSKPLQAAAHFLDAPKLERFVAANVTRSIDFVSGRARRDQS
ncbi:MAG: Rieske 2Fe-2S domain-containing protein [Actinomycetota bacterium]|nr:Rieske 2Fe-2S domain-containing protein [Actinomycetota bacterium]